MTRSLVIFALLTLLFSACEGEPPNPFDEPHVVALVDDRPVGN